MRKEKGDCHICGKHDYLSFEHVPPESAFNNKRIWVAHGSQLFEGHQPHSLQKRVQQRGAGGYTLCISCNNLTGGWYVRAYADWACQAMEILEKSKGAPTLIYPFRIYQLRIIKQIIAMFLSVNAPDFRKEIPYLEKFVLDRHSTGLPPDIRVYAGYTTGPYSRSAGKSGIFDKSGYSPKTYAVSEVAFPPFVFVLTLDSPCPESRMTDITFFASANYDEIRDLYIGLPVLPISTAYPTDYRTMKEVSKAIAAASPLAPE
jgi:hypothetical protein